MKLGLLFFMSVFILKLNGSSKTTIVYRYYEVYDDLVQAVLEGDEYRFKIAIDLPNAKPHQILTNFRTLRHVAFVPEIDEELKKLGVAVPKMVASVMVPTEYTDESPKKLHDILKDNRFDFSKRSSYRDLDFFNALKSRYDAPVVEFEDKYKDVYGKYPEDYPYKERERLACEMMIGLYSRKRRIDLDFDKDKISQVIDIKLADESDASK